MKITVFTSSYNHHRYLDKAISSVLNQTYSNIEYLLFDDGSTDNTFNIMKKYENDSRVKIFKLSKQANVGVVINKSFNISTGDYWCWCPADDVFHKTLIEKKIKYSQQYPTSILYNNFYVINEYDKIVRETLIKKMSSTEFANEVWNSSPIGFTGIFIPKYVYTSLNFPEHLNYSEDFYWMIKATIHNISFNLVPLSLHYKRKHPNSLTSKNATNILTNINVIRTELKRYQTLYNESNFT